MPGPWISSDEHESLLIADSVRKARLFIRGDVDGSDIRRNEELSQGGL